MLLIKNGRVLDPASRTDAAMDVLLDRDLIAQVAPAIKAPDAEVLDASGWIVAPGFIDLHCHLREPGEEYKETIETGTRAAARGGFTAVCCMPNTKPVNDNASVTRAILERAAAVGAVRVLPIGAASLASKGEALAEIAAMRQAGIVAVSDDGRPISSAKLLRQVLDFCSSLGLPVIDHCEDTSLSAGGVMREGPASVRLGLRGIPACAESVVVARGIQIAALTGGHFHVAHLSCRESLDQVRAAKAKGLRVTCEVTPHHFTLTDEDVLNYDTRFKMNPPLPSREDRDALLAGIADGSVDCIATDHAPHDLASKEVEFDKAAFGITGFETALALALEKLVHTSRINLMRMVELFATGPARILGFKRRIAPGEAADLTLFSPQQAWTFRSSESASKSRNTPFDGATFRGAPMATIVSGKLVWKRS
jgi:dihydroorotase